VVAYEPGAAEMTDIEIRDIPQDVTARLQWTAELMRDYRIHPPKAN
jgi:hypothetical protein